MSALYESRGTPIAGFAGAAGVVRALNGAEINIAEVFLREAVQNSFDAKKKECSNITFNMRAFSFNDEQLSNLNQLFDEGTSLKPTFYKKYLLGKFTKKMLNIEVTDTNTIGLEGFPGVPQTIDEKQRFYQFVYYTGNKKSIDSSDGGSYGYGKAASYLFSKLRTVCIYSRISEKSGNDSFHSRFIIQSIDDRITDSSCDRCWWGKEATYFDNPGTYAAPLVDKQADDIAVSIGMKKFGEKETGTKLLILDAGIDESKNSFESDDEKIKTIDDIFIYDIPRYIVHWYWPKIITEEINFNLEYKGQCIPIDNPRDIYPYSEFAIAFEEGRRKYSDKRIQESSGYKRVYKKIPFADLGFVSVKKSNVSVGRKCEYRDLFKNFENPIPSVAFMRGIGHIVFYNHYNFVDPNIMKETCFGVFKVNAKSCTANGKEGEIDRYFRDIEDQTHERWVHKKEKGPNFLAAVKDAVEGVIKSTVAIEDVSENAVANLSVVIQRTLGSKLMLAPTSYGGAKKPLKDDAFSENTIAARKSSFRPTGKRSVSLDTKSGEKLINIEYRATVKPDKVLVISEVTPFIKDADGNKIATSELSFHKFNIIKRDRSGDTTVSFTKLPLKIVSSGDYTLSILCKKNCAFTVDITSEEE